MLSLSNLFLLTKVQKTVIGWSYTTNNLVHRGLASYVVNFTATEVELFSEFFSTLLV